MPGFDRTGPLGAGPMSGGGWGKCVGAERPFTGYGRRYGRGRGVMSSGGFGRGGGRAVLAGRVPTGTVTAEDERDYLEAEAQQLQQQLQAINQRIDELQQKSE